MRIRRLLLRSPSMPVGPGGAVIKLNVKAVGDADGVDDIVRIMMPGGVIGVADIREEAERNGSPVKVYLGPALEARYRRKLDD